MSNLQDSPGRHVHELGDRPRVDPPLESLSSAVAAGALPVVVITVVVEDAWRHSHANRTGVVRQVSQCNKGRRWSFQNHETRRLAIVW